MSVYPRSPICVRTRMGRVYTLFITDTDGRNVIMKSFFINKCIILPNKAQSIIKAQTHRYRTTNQICACAEWDRKYSAILKLRKRHTNQWGGWLTEVDFITFLSYFWVDFNQIKSNIFLKNYTLYVYNFLGICCFLFD